MDKATAIFEKLALISGADYTDPKYMPYSSKVPFSIRKERYSNYVKTKAKEDKSTWPQALTFPSVSGGVVGTLVGAAQGRNSFSGKWAIPALIGAGIGASLGALVGTVNKKLDDKEIEYVKSLLASKNVDKAIKDSLIDRLEEMYTREELYREFKNDARHRELINAIEKKGELVTDKATYVFEKYAAAGWWKKIIGLGKKELGKTTDYIRRELPGEIKPLTNMKKTNIKNMDDFVKVRGRIDSSTSQRMLEKQVAKPSGQIPVSSPWDAKRKAEALAFAKEQRKMGLI